MLKAGIHYMILFRFLDESMLVAESQSQYNKKNPVVCGGTDLRLFAQDYDFIQSEDMKHV